MNTLSSLVIASGKAAWQSRAGANRTGLLRYARNDEGVISLEGSVG
jgi:hypothetical protein